jgi:homoprotocatechuate degradation regulator HpaR
MKTYRRNLPLLLLSVREQVRSHFQPAFREFGISEQQWRILRLLHENGPVGITGIADRCLILRPSIVGIIVRMEDLGLVSRKADAGDKRRIRISLAPKGEALVNKILPLFETIYEDLEAAVGKAQLNQLYRLLEAMTVHLAAYELKKNRKTVKGTAGARGLIALER